jgi:ABC-type glycerol-3-phosphate transport system permease component
VIMLVPVLAVFFSAQRYFIQGVQFAGLSGR